MTIKRAPTSGRGVARGLASMLDIPADIAERGGQPAVAAMMELKRARDAGGGGLRMQHIAHAQRHMAHLSPTRDGRLVQHLQAITVALGGRGGDTRIAHVTPGEIVIPQRLQTPQMLAVLQIAARAHGIDPSRLRIGSPSNSVNPRTGQIEFQDDDFDSDEGAGSDDVAQPAPDNGNYTDADGNPIEGITVTTPREHGLVQLPQNLPNSGFYNYGTPGNGAAQYGLPSTMGVLGAAGSQWNAEGNAPFGVGNMSLSDGTQYSSHVGQGHMNGTGVDIRPIRNDGKQASVTYKDPAYDRAATQQLVDTLRATGGVDRIFFNDPQINGVTPDHNGVHDNHLHVQVSPSWQRGSY